jgi:hypothetical protein
MILHVISLVFDKFTDVAGKANAENFLAIEYSHRGLKGLRITLLGKEATKKN